MIVDKIISRLEGVRSTGEDRWIARCPAHEDKSPSLAIREVDDRVLIHCFAGCGVHEVVSAVGLEMSDLFPRNIPVEGHKPISRPFPAADILQCLSSEALFLSLVAISLAKIGMVEDSDKNRLIISANRFRSALYAGGLL